MNLFILLAVVCTLAADGIGRIFAAPLLFCSPAHCSNGRIYPKNSRQDKLKRWGDQDNPPIFCFLEDLVQGSHLA